MPLLNYTTTVPVDRSVNEIHKILVRAGARQISTQYDDAGTATAIAFAVDTGFGSRRFVLPVRAEQVFAVLYKDKIERKYKTRQHADRVAWRIIKDWTEAQLALLRADLVTLDQVMLPYMLDEGSGRTVYDIYRDQQLALEP